MGLARDIYLFDFVPIPERRKDSNMFGTLAEASGLTGFYPKQNKATTKWYAGC
jgi:hypothetical protein